MHGLILTAIGVCGGVGGFERGCRGVLASLFSALLAAGEVASSMAALSLHLC